MRSRFSVLYIPVFGIVSALGIAHEPAMREEATKLSHFPERAAIHVRPAGSNEVQIIPAMLAPEALSGPQDLTRSPSAPTPKGTTTLGSGSKAKRSTIVGGASRHQLNWEAILGWVGALSQVTIGIAAIAIAWRTYKYTTTSNRLTFYKYLTDSVNEWNRVIIENPENSRAISKLRPPIVDHPTDSLVFMYLNYLRFNYVVGTETLIAPSTLRARLTSGVNWFRTFNRATLEKYLSRGYEHDFVQLMLAAYDSSVFQSETPPLAPEPPEVKPAG